ncbi:hypothetical protein [Paenibacillus humicola]|uniref:hypothetical protein n=1 Tax=Paenibacillus humicola TaxID=3110540 RepID=UPI00237BDEB0|nr:hypothetical protein [Paenibacillus humicola]
MKSAFRQRVEDLKSRLPKEHQEIGHYLEHVLDSLDSLEEEHLRLVAAYAYQGYKVSGDNEQVFNETILTVKQQLFATFEKTVDDILHKGDKRWDRNFKDGTD